MEWVLGLAVLFLVLKGRERATAPDGSAVLYNPKVAGIRASTILASRKTRLSIPALAIPSAVSAGKVASGGGGGGGGVVGGGGGRGGQTIGE